MNHWKSFTNTVFHWVWSPPLLILILVVGLYLTIVTRGVQFRYLWHGHKLAFTRCDEQAEGDISHFQALMTALSGTIGIGSITGVATAIAVGGPGALFWMWTAALLGMATKFSEAILAIKYRTSDENGEMCGGPMYYIEKGMQWKWMGKLFAIFGVITAVAFGNMVQSNSVVLAIEEGWGINPLWAGLVLMVFVGITLVKGIKSIGKVNGVLVPAMAIFYILGGLIILGIHIEKIPMAFVVIFQSAFYGKAAVGGAVGTSIMIAIQLGVSRSIFSSEAGLGSSPVIAAAAKTNSPGQQALVSMCTVFLTVGIVCTITGLVVIVSGILGEIDTSKEMFNGSAIMLRAFNATFPFGSAIVTIALISFGYSTILGWAYCGEKYVEYLVGCRFNKTFRLLYTLIVIPGSVMSLCVVWDFANIMNGLTTLPNLIALFALGTVVAKETRFFDLQHRQETKN
ncbi:MAG: sodium:alanine symporter family protein [Simkaniaceae bacterium]|nr:sodium:alanine symporter family protein [Simkaniaceae bacterium]